MSASRRWPGENSEDPSAGQGGDLGWIGLGLTDAAFEKAAFAAAQGAVVGPVRSAFGVHLIQVVAIRRSIESDEQREARCATKLRQKMRATRSARPCGRRAKERWSSCSLRWLGSSSAAATPQGLVRRWRSRS